MKFLPGVEPIEFKEKEHQYFSKGKELISATTLIHLYVPPFDPTGEIIARCAARDGKTVDKLRAEWDLECTKKCDSGHVLHKQMEHWIDHRKILPGDFDDVVKQFAKFKFNGKLISETIVYSNTLGIAGTVDLIDHYGDNEADLLDFKQNKSLKKQSFFHRDKGGFEKMLHPVSHLMNCNFVTYSLQMCLYALLLEEYGCWVNEKTLLYLNPKTRVLERHATLNLRKEMEAIIEHYASGGKETKKLKALKTDDFDF